MQNAKTNMIFSNIAMLFCVIDLDLDLYRSEFGQNVETIPNSECMLSIFYYSIFMKYYCNICPSFIRVDVLLANY